MPPGLRKDRVRLRRMLGVTGGEERIACLLERWVAFGAHGPVQRSRAPELHLRPLGFWFYPEGERLVVEADGAGVRVQRERAFACFDEHRTRGCRDVVGRELRGPLELERAQVMVREHLG